MTSNLEARMIPEAIETYLGSDGVVRVKRK